MYIFDNDCAMFLFYYEPLSGATVGGGAMLVAASHYPLLFAPFRGGDVCVMPHCGAEACTYLPIVGRGRLRHAPLWGGGAHVFAHCGAAVFASRPVVGRGRARICPLWGGGAPVRGLYYRIGACPYLRQVRVTLPL